MHLVISHPLAPVTPERVFVVISLPCLNLVRRTRWATTGFKSPVLNSARSI